VCSLAERRSFEHPFVWTRRRAETILAPCPEPPPDAVPAGGAARDPPRSPVGRPRARCPPRRSRGARPGDRRPVARFRRRRAHGFRRRSRERPGNPLDDRGRNAVVHRPRLLGDDSRPAARLEPDLAAGHPDVPAGPEESGRARDVRRDVHLRAPRPPRGPLRSRSVRAGARRGGRLRPAPGFDRRVHLLHRPYGPVDAGRDRRGRGCGRDTGGDPPLSSRSVRRRTGRRRAAPPGLGAGDVARSARDRPARGRRAPRGDRPRGRRRAGHRSPHRRGGSGTGDARPRPRCRPRGSRRRAGGRRARRGADDGRGSGLRTPPARRHRDPGPLAGDQRPDDGGDRRRAPP